jgi:hypothetical protein
MAVHIIAFPHPYAPALLSGVAASEINAKFKPQAGTAVPKRGGFVTRRQLTLLPPVG